MTDEAEVAATLKANKPTLLKPIIFQGCAFPKLFSLDFRFPLLLAFLLAMFNQLSGINFILYYAPSILENAGFASSESLLSSVSLGGINLLFTFVGLYFIDRLGRKQLMYIGSIGYIVSLCMVAYAFYTEAAPCLR